MTNPRCVVCGHVNRVGVVVCEMCDSRLDVPEGARASSSHGAREPGGYAGFGGEGAAFDGEERRDGSLPTDIPSPQFKGAGDVISPTLEVYRKHFLLVGLLVLVTMLPLVLLQYSLVSAVTTGGYDGDDGGSIGAAAVASGFGGTALYWILTTLGGSLLSGALAYAVVQIQRTGAARAGESLMWGLRKMLKVFAVTLITYLLIYCAPALVLVILGAALGPVALVAFLLMLLPWIVVVLTFSLAVPAAAIENRGVFESLTRSVELTKGYKGLLFLTYFLWWVVIILLNVVTTWSFYHGGGSGGGGPEGSLLLTLVQMLVSGMLSSSMFVLTVYIFLGILNENRQGFAANAYAHGPESAAL
ncbi:MAG: hypothetical protein ABW250_16930 [Pyrinomonadaceae bacterium]